MQPKKRRRRLNRLGKITLFAIIVIFMAICSLPGYLANKELKELGYTKEGIAAIKKQGMSQFIRTNDYYSALLEDVIKDGAFDINYLDYYLTLPEFTSEQKQLTDKLIAKGYSSDELIKLYKAKTLKELVPLLVYEKVGDIDGYLKHHTDITDNSLLNPYENMILLNEYSTDMLINKKSQLTAEVLIDNLRDVNYYCAFNPTTLVEEAANAFEEMCFDARDVGVYFASTYGYRSYEEQKEIYDSYVEEGGVEYANKIASQPGSSEHQAGLAVDIASMKKLDDQKFIDTAEYHWLQENAHKYGFIERYVAGAEEITGYDAEPWHWRYLGTELATKVKESGLTYDEYFALHKAN